MKNGCIKVLEKSREDGRKGINFSTRFRFTPLEYCGTGKAHCRLLRADVIYSIIDLQTFGLFQFNDACGTAVTVFVFAEIGWQIHTCHIKYVL